MQNTVVSQVDILDLGSSGERDASLSADLRAMDLDVKVEVNLRISLSTPGIDIPSRL
jgi:hypothetical protein